MLFASLDDIMPENRRLTTAEIEKVKAIVNEMRAVYNISETEYIVAFEIIQALDMMLLGLSPELKVKLLRFVVSTHEMVAKEVGLIK